MSQFTTPLELEYIDGRHWKILAEFIYYTGASLQDLTGHVIAIPAGFLTDFASIPRFLWITMPPTGKYGKAAVIHDYLYRNGGRIPSTSKTFNRGECDQIFRDAMKVLGVSRYRRTVMWLGVRAGGWASFKDAA